VLKEYPLAANGRCLTLSWLRKPPTVVALREATLKPSLIRPAMQVQVVASEVGACHAAFCVALLTVDRATASAE